MQSQKRVDGVFAFDASAAGQDMTGRIVMPIVETGLVTALPKEFSYLQLLLGPRRD
jgi:hypothetical protein